MSNRLLYKLTPDILLRAYAAGIFPMADSAEATDIHWFSPPLRAIIPLESFHVPRRLNRTLRQRPYMVKLNTAFSQVIRSCAEPTYGRTTTWINQEIIRLYVALHWRGHAHSIEVWDNACLVGGLYGVSLGGAFFGESMFSRATDTSKIALCYLVSLLRYNNFSMLDTQFMTEHLAQFGTAEVTRANYQLMLELAIAQKARLTLPTTPDWDELSTRL